LVADRIEHRDDVAFDVDRVRHVHVAADRAPQSFSQYGLPVSRRSVEEDRLVGVCRGTELLQDVVGYDQVVEASLQPLTIDIATRRSEHPHLRDVAGQRHRRDARVGIDFEVLKGACPAKVGQRVPVTRARRAGGAAHLEQALGTQALDDRFEDAEWQPQPGGQCQAGQLAAVQMFDQQLLELVRAKSRVFETRRNRRRGCRPDREFFDDGGGRRHLFTIGNRTCTNLIAAGPIVTTQIAGKMQNTSGKTILTPVFAAASSARCLRLVRSVSDWTRSDCATLVPNLSVWTSIATSDEMSSTPVRVARLRSASVRALPARSSRLIIRSSPARSGWAKASSSPTR